MKVRRYFVGFGPTLWSRSNKLGETEYGLKAVPLGGFCEIVGMLPSDKDGTSDERNTAMLPSSSTTRGPPRPSTSRRATRTACSTRGRWKQVIVLAAGPR